jgi:hypothetical protein
MYSEGSELLLHWRVGRVELPQYVDLMGDEANVDELLYQAAGRLEKMLYTDKCNRRGFRSRHVTRRQHIQERETRKNGHCNSLSL